MSNTDVHMSSFESNDSNVTHDTIPHKLCKTHNTNNKQFTNQNCQNNTSESNNDKLQMSSTLQTNYKQHDA